MGRPKGKMMSAEAFVAFAGLLGAFAIGAWWTGMAIAQGAVGSTMIRFLVSIAGCCYYLVLYRIASFSVHRPSYRFR